MTWLLTSLGENISGNVMFLTTAQKMWETLKVIYGNKKNPSMVFEIYERLFELKQGDKSVPEFYRELKGLIDELEMHQPIVTDAAILRGILRGYCQDLAVLKFLLCLSPSLRSQVRCQILGGDNIPTLTATFSRIMHVSTEADVTTAPSIEHSAMASGRGRGRGREHDFIGGRDLFGGHRGSYGGRQTVGDKGLRQCKHCGRNNHISEKCWEKFGRPEWAQLVDTDTPLLGDITYVPAPSIHYGTSESLTVVL